MTIDRTDLRTESYRVRMSDVDAAGIIYYANPYLWREGVFSNWLADIGHPQVSLIATATSAPCVASGAVYHRPLHLDDVVELQLWASRPGRSSFKMNMDIIDPVGELAVSVHTTNVWTRVLEGRMESAPLPDWLRSALEGSGD